MDASRQGIPTAGADFCTMIGAFVIGLVGSLHCVGMCGPLMMTFVGPKQSKVTFALYHTGRIISYILIGLALGMIGQSFQFFKIQQVVTILLGAALLVIYAVPNVRNRLEKAYFNSMMYRSVGRVLSKNLSVKKRWFISGAANGFLPCGLTYVATAGAVAMGGLVTGAGFMLIFGLGTLPALAALTFGSTLISNRFRQLIPKSIPVIAILSGAILMLRGFLLTFPDFNQMVAMKAAGLITVCGLQ